MEPIKGLDKNYIKLLDRIKISVRKAQIKASLSVNRELIKLYFHIGKLILTIQNEEGWGKSIVERLSKDLSHEFSDLKGFSTRNLWNMRQFYFTYQKHRNLQQLVAEIPWGHNLVLLNSIKNNKDREWYIYHIIENGWSRNVLIHQIKSDLINRKGKAVTNFKKTLPNPQSDLAQQILKDPYHFEFLTIDEKIREKELENNLIQHLQSFLLELGLGFAFIARQKCIEIANKNYYIDLLFYHAYLHSYIVIELKTGEFKPEYAGKMNFYLSAVDDLIKHPEDNPSIGLIICKTKNNIIVEYALRDSTKPIGVSSYILTKKLPKKFKGNFPTIKELEKEISLVEYEIGENRNGK